MLSQVKRTCGLIATDRNADTDPKDRFLQNAMANAEFGPDYWHKIQFHAPKIAIVAIVILVIGLLLVWLSTKRDQDS